MTEQKLYYQQMKDEYIDGELWRDVVGFKGAYQISNLGRPRSLDRKSSNGRKIKGKLLSPRHRRDNYWDFSLYDQNGDEHKVLLHQVVADAWVPHYDYSFDEVHHVNGDPNCNVAKNLQWVDQERNNDDPIRWQRIEDAKAKHYGKQLVVVNKKSLVYVNSIKEAAEKIGCTYSKLSAGIRYGNWVKGWRIGYTDNVKIQDTITALLVKHGIKITVWNKDEDGNYVIKPLETA